MEVAPAFDLPGLVLISTGGNGHIIRRIYPEIDIVGEAVTYRLEILSGRYTDQPGVGRPGNTTDSPAGKGIGK